jgi:hypothetical protein
VLKKRQPNSFGPGSPSFVKEADMMNREILMDKNDIPPDGIPTGLEG